jgi:hypothetical protein
MLRDGGDGVSEKKCARCGDRAETIDNIAETALVAELEIQRLAREIAKQRPTYSATSTPAEIARALYLLGWKPPHKPSEQCQK